MMMQMFHSLRTVVRGLLLSACIVAGVSSVAFGFDSSPVSGRASTASQEVAWPAVKSPVAKDPRMEARITALLGQLTLEQKVAQMVQADIRYVTPEDVRKYRLGSILNGGGAFPGNEKHAAVSDLVALADRFYDASMDSAGGAPPIPIMWGTDAVHGHNN